MNKNRKTKPKRHTFVYRTYIYTRRHARVYDTNTDRYIRVGDDVVIRYYSVALMRARVLKISSAYARGRRLFPEPRRENPTEAAIVVNGGGGRSVVIFTLSPAGHRATDTGPYSLYDGEPTTTTTKPFVYDENARSMPKRRATLSGRGGCTAGPRPPYKRTTAAAAARSIRVSYARRWRLTRLLIGFLVG